MTCEQRKDLIPLMPLGALDPEEALEINAHLSGGCPVCEGCLAEADALLSLLPMSLPPVTPPSAIKEKLMNRVRAGSSHSTRPQTWKIHPATIAMAATVILCIGLSMILVSSQRHAAANLRAQLAHASTLLAQKESQVQQLRADVIFMQDAVHTVTSPTVQVVGLKGAAQPTARGRVYVDRTRRKLLFSADGFKPVASDKTYELWLVSGNKKIPIGTFNADARGEAALAVEIPGDIGPLAAAAVTDEPAGGVPQPTGQFQIIGAAEQ